MPCICDGKLEIGVKGRVTVRRREGNHARRGIHADNCACWNAGRNFGRGLSVPTTDVKNLFHAREVK
jgi:hypothetical protein